MTPWCPRATDEPVDLADDIARNGLLHPIVLDADGRVLDGRNRLAACEMASVEPVFETYGGTDPDAYAFSVNIARRFLSKGQQAMVAARACPVSGQTMRAVSEATGVTKSRIGQAALVLTHAPDLVDAVTTGAMGLDAAYTEAQKRKQAANSEETKQGCISGPVSTLLQTQPNHGNTSAPRGSQQAPGRLQDPPGARRATHTSRPRAAHSSKRPDPLPRARLPDPRRRRRLVVGDRPEQRAHRLRTET